MDYDPDRSSIWMRNTGQPGDGLRRFGRDMNGGSISYNELKSWPPITESQRRISSYEWIIGDSRSVIPSTNLEKKYIRNQKKEDGAMRNYWDMEKKKRDLNLLSCKNKLILINGEGLRNPMANESGGIRLLIIIILTRTGHSSINSLSLPRPVLQVLALSQTYPDLPFNLCARTSCLSSDDARHQQRSRDLSSLV